MVRRSKEDAMETKSTILDSAVELFVKQGVAYTTLAQIADHAGVTRGAIYHHFKNKGDVFSAIQQRCFGEFEQDIINDLSNLSQSPLTQLKALCTSLFKDLTHDEEVRQTLMVFSLKCDYTGEFEAVLDAQECNKARAIELFSQYFKAAIEAGELTNNISAEALATSLFIYLRGYKLHALETKDIQFMKNHVNDFIAIFFNGILQK